VSLELESVAEMVRSLVRVGTRSSGTCASHLTEATTLVERRKKARLSPGRFGQVSWNGDYGMSRFLYRKGLKVVLNRWSDASHGDRVAGWGS